MSKAILVVLYLWPCIAGRNASTGIRPFFNEGQPVTVYVGVFAESIDGLSARYMSFNADLYLYLSWQDDRLLKHASDKVINDPRFLSQIWRPDIYFGNAKHAKFQDVTVPNFALYINENGTISYSTRVTLEVSCNLELQNYPLDKQKCPIKLLSYAHTSDDMVVTWFSDSPLRWNQNIELNDFSVNDFQNETCTGTYDYALMEGSKRNGEFSCLAAVLYLRRAVGYHVVQTYIPTGMIVIISWVSFWIDRTAVPARVSLSFTTLLTLSTMGSGLRYALPAVSYAKALDFWFGMCTLFVFAALLEFALVNSLMRRMAKCLLMQEDMANSSTTNAENDGAVSQNPQPQPGVLNMLAVRSGQNNNNKPRSISNGPSSLPFNVAAISNKGILRACSRSNNSTSNGPKRKSGADMYDVERANLVNDYWMPNEKLTIRRTESEENIRDPARAALIFSRRALLIDKMSRIFFPVTFLLFNLIYWDRYMFHVVL